eukprot:gene4339-7695_t
MNKKEKRKNDSTDLLKSTSNKEELNRKYPQQKRKLSGTREQSTQKKQKMFHIIEEYNKLKKNFEDFTNLIEEFQKPETSNIKNIESKIVQNDGELSVEISDLEANKILVKNFPGFERKNIRNKFKQCGKIADIIIVREEPKAIFVKFVAPQGVEKAMELFGNKSIEKAKSDSSDSESDSSSDEKSNSKEIEQSDSSSDSESDSSSSDESESSDTENQKKNVKQSNGSSDSESNSSDSESDSSSDEKSNSKEIEQSDSSSDNESDSSDSESDSSSDEKSDSEEIKQSDSSSDNEGESIDTENQKKNVKQSNGSSDSESNSSDSESDSSLDEKSDSEEIEQSDSSSSESESRDTENQKKNVILVRNLPFGEDEYYKKLFSEKCGVILSFRRLKNKSKVSNGFIEFKSSKSITKALKMKFENEKIKVEIAKSNPKLNVEKIIVKRFPNCDRTRVSQFFEKCGKIDDIFVVKKFGKPNGPTFVKFATSDGVNKALELNNSVVDGYNICVEIAPTRDNRNQNKNKNAPAPKLENDESDGLSFLN